MRKSKLLIFTAIALLIIASANLTTQASAALSTGDSSPTKNSGGWSHPTKAYVNGDGYASSASSNQQHKYGGYGFNLPSSAAITGVLIRLDAWCQNNDAITVEVSPNKGNTFLSTAETISLSGTQTTYSVDVTGWTTWTTEKINNDQIWVRVTHTRQGGSDDAVYLDWIPVTITYTIAPTVPAPQLNPSSTITYGGSVTASVTISGVKHVTPTGNVDFQVSTDGGSTYTKFGATKTLSCGSATSDPYTPAAAGSNYRFRAVYYGDSNYNGATGPAKCLTVNKASTTIKNLNCYPNPIGKTGHATTKISGNLYSASTGIIGAQITLFYNDGGPNWIQIATTTTTTNGYFEFDWDVPDNLENGYYYIKAKFTGTDNYCGSTAVTCKYPLHVIPEYALGGLLSLFACFAAFTTFKRTRLNSKRPE